MRIGHGYDVHAFGGEGPITIGGQRIEHTQGLIAHSDGDVLLHALCDALLGAAALGDIGHHFPDTDAEFANIDSKILLKRVLASINDKHWVLGNADMTIVAQTPKMAPHIQAMRTTIAEICNVSEEAINVKATTTEKLGFVGKKQGIAAHAVVLLVSASA
jgi:2-C-methyl-D-erythritol 2,4-cyclodiphosphate synthase